MSQMFDLKPVGIFAGDQVDLGIPLTQERRIFMKLFPSFLLYIREPFFEGLP
jgi:hypothetical protein